MASNKIVSLKEAISTVQDGDIVYLGGIIDGRRPVGAMYEIARQGKKNLIGLSFIAVEDILVSAGCLRGVRGCYTHLGIFGKAPGVHRALANNQLIIDEVGHVDAQLQLMAPAVGIPYVASSYSIGSDIVNPHLDRSEELRAIARNKDKIPPRKYIFSKNPFSDKEEPVVLLPGIKPDIAIIHVGQVGTQRTCRIFGNPALDQYAAFAADRVIITAEEVVSESYLRRDPNRNYIPTNQVDLIVHLPWGAHPSLNPGYYDLDMEFLAKYQAVAKTEEGFAQWSQEWIYGVQDHNEYLSKLGVKKMQQLTAVKPFGFKPRSDIELLV
ncbi:MAG: CoA-transferase [Syntrophomonadaceae bacterium]|nr:CoA-transferase [Syntrophomonadaceae bacterium]